MNDTIHKRLVRELGEAYRVEPIDNEQFKVTLVDRPGEFIGNSDILTHPGIAKYIVARLDPDQLTMSF